MAATAALAGLAAAAAQAQSGDSGNLPPGPPPAARPSPATSPAAPAPPAAPERLAPVQITGSRPDEVQERRNATAAKIVIGREEIDRFGDATLGEVLKRLPGVTLQGAPNRGGAVRLRGLGNGYTQILLDGERVPPGFSIDSLSPEQIERIEILRAPTAETGARAIAGTINIVTRGGYTRPLNDVRLGLGVENERPQASLAWTRNFTSGPFIVNYSLSAFARALRDRTTTTTVDDRLDDGTRTFEQKEDERSRVSGRGVNATARLQWRGDGGVDAVTLTPILFFNRFRFDRDESLVQTIGEAPFDSARSSGANQNTLLRLNGEWTHRLASAGRIETRAGVGRSRLPVSNVRVEESAGEAPRTLEETSDGRTTSLTASAKIAETLFEEHQFVAGAEYEGNRRRDERSNLDDGVPQLTEYGTGLRTSAARLAAYAQDEWSVTPHWSAQLGLRWEQITTRGSLREGEADARNRSSVWTPLFHALWKPDPKGRDQVRLSLTRSYRSPTLGNLVARPSIDTRDPVPGPNTPTRPDRAGNPDLRPELATGIDLAVERYLPGSGVLSANVFRRNIRDYIRSRTTLEDVSYADVPRYVLRAENVGKAVTQGLELEAKFRVSDLWADAPKVDVRANVSVFRSHVKGVSGPNDRLDQQPDYTANLGADHRFAGWPLTVGGSVNWTPGYTTRLSDAQTASIGPKLVADAYVLWVFNPKLQLRVSASNLDARDYAFGSSVDGVDLQKQNVRESTRTTSPSFVTVQSRLELKL